MTTMREFDEAVEEAANLLVETYSAKGETPITPIQTKSIAHWIDSVMRSLFETLMEENEQCVASIKNMMNQNDELAGKLGQMKSDHMELRENAFRQFNVGFHRLWGEAKDLDCYSKLAWISVQAQVERLEYGGPKLGTLNTESPND